MPAQKRKERRVQRPSASTDSKASRGTRRCPRCHRKTLEFTPKVAVIVQPTPVRRETDAQEDRQLRLRYEPAWLCQNRSCRYVKLAARRKG